MADLEQQLHEDRLLRNAARRLVKGDLLHVKGDMAQRGLGGRLLGRAKDGAAEIADNAGDYMGNHRAQLGTGVLVGVVAVVGWMFRDQLADAVYNLVHRGEDPIDELAEKAEQVAEDARSLTE